LLSFFYRGRLAVLLLNRAVHVVGDLCGILGRL